MLAFLLMAVIGIERFQKNPGLRRHLRGQVGILVVQCFLSVVHPGFGVIYSAIPAGYRPFFTIAFPLLTVCRLCIARL